MEKYAKLEFIDEPFYTKLRVGTDCSGIEAPIQALRQLKIPFKHIFSSDIDKYCIQSIKANYEPEIIFGDKEGPFPEGDITKRNIEDVPNIDLYVCGFPCQPFSQAGQRKGFKDKRGNVFWSCLEVIEIKQPKYFILENVKGLLGHDKENKKDKYGNTFKVIWKALLELEKYGYKVYWKVMNTRDYGIPQNRERVYFVGTKKEFEWPQKVEMDDLKNYVDWENNKVYNNLSEKRHKFLLSKKNIFTDLSFINWIETISYTSYAPCLNTRNAIWCIPQRRYATIYELLYLQGFTYIFNIIVSQSQLKKQIGNSMSVNVVYKILSNLIIF